MTGVSYATRPRWPRSWVRSRASRKTRAHAAVMRNHRRALRGKDGYEKVAQPPVRLDHAPAWRSADSASSSLSRIQVGWDAPLRSAKAWLSQRAIHCHCADRTIGLRMIGEPPHRAGLRAGQVQEARRRRLLQIINRAAGSAAHARLFGKPHCRDRGLASAMARFPTPLRHQYLDAAGQGLVDDGWPSSKGAADCSISSFASTWTLAKICCATGSALRPR